MSSDKPRKPAGDTTENASLTLEARRAFLQLPVEDRHYLLAKMATAPDLIAHYDHEAGLLRQLAECRAQVTTLQRELDNRAVLLHETVGGTTELGAEPSANLEAQATATQEEQLRADLVTKMHAIHAKMRDVSEAEIDAALDADEEAPLRRGWGPWCGDPDY